MKRICVFFLLSVAAVARCFSTEVILIDSSNQARVVQSFSCVNVDMSAPAKAIFIDEHQVTVQEYIITEDGMPEFNVSIYTKFPGK